MRRCCYPVYTCRLQALAGSDFCLRHVRVDPNSTYQQCSFRTSDNQSSVSSFIIPGKDNAYTCPNAVTNSPVESFCTDHANEMLSHYQHLSSKSVQSDDAMSIHHRLEPLSDLTAANCDVAPLDEAAIIGKPRSTIYADEYNCLNKCPSEPPFVMFNKTAKLESLSKNYVRSVVDECEPSEPPPSADPVCNYNIEHLWWADDGGDSDPESVDSESDDVLKYAGVYTAEEFVRLMREKLIRLQKLYIDQFQQLHKQLTSEIELFRQRSAVETMRRFAKRRHDSRDLDSHQPTVHNITASTIVSNASNLDNVPRSEARHRDTLHSYGKLCALNHYGRPHGCEIMLQKMLDDKRERLSSSASAGFSKSASARVINSHQSPAKTTSSFSGAEIKLEGNQDGSYSEAVSHPDVVPCIFNLSTSVKCGQPSLPLARHCVRHILSDTSQVLFRACCGGTEIAPAAADTFSSKDSSNECVTKSGNGDDQMCPTPTIDTCVNPVVNFVSPVQQGPINDADGQCGESAGHKSSVINRCMYHSLIPPSLTTIIDS